LKSGIGVAGHRGGGRGAVEAAFFLGSHSDI
jgi:hypothetical protein